MHEGSELRGAQQRVMTSIDKKDRTADKPGFRPEQKVHRGGDVARLADVPDRHRGRERLHRGAVALVGRHPGAQRGIHDTRPFLGGIAPTTATSL